MPLNNKIQVLNLSDKAVQLRAEGLSFRQISTELTKRARQPITYHVVQKFFSKREHDAIEVVGKSDKLKTKIVEAEINTIEECMKCLADLQDVFDRAMEEGDLRAAILATGEKWKGIDIINKVLGKYQNLPEMVSVTNNTVYVSLDQKVKEYEKYFTELESSTHSENS
jgi:hypothetical protein